MAQYVYFGRVHPERGNLSISMPFQFQQIVPEEGIDTRVSVSISRSQFTCVADADGVPNEKLPSLTNYIRELIGRIIDCLGWLEGAAYDVELTGVLLPNGELNVLGVYRPQLGLGTALLANAERGVDLTRVFTHALSDSYAASALIELRLALKIPALTFMFAYSALERIRSGIDPAVDPDSQNQRAQAWERFRTELNIDRAGIDWIRLNARPTRHGATPYVSGGDRDICLGICWLAVERYLFWLTDKQPLHNRPALTKELIERDWPAFKQRHSI